MRYSHGDPAKKQRSRDGAANNILAFRHPRHLGGFLAPLPARSLTIGEDAMMQVLAEKELAVPPRRLPLGPWTHRACMGGEPRASLRRVRVAARFSEPASSFIDQTCAGCLYRTAPNLLYTGTAGHWEPFSSGSTDLREI